MLSARRSDSKLPLQKSPKNGAKGRSWALQNLDAPKMQPINSSNNTKHSWGFMLSKSHNNGLVLAAMRKISSRANRMLAPRFGQQLGYVLNSEYPKAGGTWFGKMAAEIMQLPYPEHNAFPTGCPCVLHNHWNWSPKLPRGFYLTRDGRMSWFRSTSTGFNNSPRTIQSPSADLANGTKDSSEKAGIPMIPSRISAAFIQDEFDRPRDSRQNWRDHVMNWHDGGRGRSNVIYLTYEQLISNPQATVTRVITEMTGQEPDPWVVNQTVDKYDMKQSDRWPGRRGGRPFVVHPQVWLGTGSTTFPGRPPSFSSTCRRRHHLLGV